MTEPFQLTAWEAAEALRRRSLSAFEMTDSVLKWIKQLEPKVHIFQVVIADEPITGGFNSQGLPMGIQLIGPPLSESRLLNVAHNLQLGTDHHKKRPLLS